MVELKKVVPLKLGDGICLSFPLGHSDKYLQFNAEVKHAQGTLAGMEFLDTDLGTLVELHSLLKANTDNIDDINREFNLSPAPDVERAPRAHLQENFLS